MEARISRSFSGKLDGKRIGYFTNQLDRSIDSLEDRVELLHDILNTKEYRLGEKGMDEFFEQYFDVQHKRHFLVSPNTSGARSDNDLVCRQIEYMANYILLSKENLDYNKESEYPLMKDEKFGKAMESSYESIKEKGGDKLEEVLKNEKPNQFKYQTDDSITFEDMEKYEVIGRLQDAVMYLGTLRDCDDGKISKKEKASIGRMMSGLKSEQSEIRDMIERPIRFNNVDSGRSKYTFWDNTGYYKDDGEYVLISNNKIELGNYKHVYQLLKYYGGIKELIGDDVDSDWRYLLWELETLIDETPMDDYERDIIIWKIDGLDDKIILDMLKEEYGIEFSQQYLSSLFTSKIPRKIVATYIEDKIDWHYYYKIKGNWKKCSMCGDIKLETSSYFGKRSKDRFYAHCRECERLRKTKNAI